MNSFPSIFNDVIGPVMRGPSSSHTAASWRVARMAVQMIDGPLKHALIEFDKDGAWVTNYEEITFKHVIGAPTNKSEVTAPKGIEAFVDGYPIAAMQYYSGGSFSYKKFIWISNKTEAQMQLVMAAVFSAMLEIGDYFEDNGFVE